MGLSRTWEISRILTRIIVNEGHNGIDQWRYESLHHTLARVCYLIRHVRLIQNSIWDLWVLIFFYIQHMEWLALLQPTLLIEGDLVCLIEQPFSTGHTRWQCNIPLPCQWQHGVPDGHPYDISQNSIGHRLYTYIQYWLLVIYWIFLEYTRLPYGVTFFCPPQVYTWFP